MFAQFFCGCRACQSRGFLMSVHKIFHYFFASLRSFSVKTRQSLKVSFCNGCFWQRNFCLSSPSSLTQQSPLFIFEASQVILQLILKVLSWIQECERCYSESPLRKIFRSFHTKKHGKCISLGLKWNFRLFTIVVYKTLPTIPLPR